MEETITIELFGQSFSFKTQIDAETAKEIADLLVREVDSVTQEHTGKTSGMNKLAILTIAAMNIANEYIELKRNHMILLENISSKSASLLKTIDVSLH